MASLSVIKVRFSHFRRRRVLCLLLTLLFISGVKLNPGPPQTSHASHTPSHPSHTPSPLINSGFLNIRSAVNTAALIHDLIDSSHLNLLWLTETWIDAKAPAAIKQDLAPAGYQVLHAHRSGKKSRGGGIALIYRSDLKVSPLPLKTNQHTTFESLCVKICSKSQRVNSACIYKPPPHANTLFFD